MLAQQRPAEHSKASLADPRPQLNLLCCATLALCKFVTAATHINALGDRNLRFFGSDDVNRQFAGIVAAQGATQWEARTTHFYFTRSTGIKAFVLYVR